MAEPQRSQLPALKVTQYDVVSSFLISLALALVVSVVLLSLVWAAISFRPRHAPVPVEFVEDVTGGGVEDGSIDETLRVDTPEAPNPDATPADVPTADADVRESLSNMEETSADVTDVVAEGVAVIEENKEPELDVRLGEQTTRKAGSLEGTGRRRPLGQGKGNGGGVARELRWYVTFAENETLNEYARQLDFFGIELGALLEGGKIAYVSQLSSAVPKKRMATSGANEKRLYMVWQGGNRRKADIQLLKKAGIDAEQAQIFQFYPPETEQMLAVLERDYRHRKIIEVRRTYFSVVKAGKGYEFRVTQQMFFTAAKR